MGSQMLNDFVLFNQSHKKLLFWLFSKLCFWHWVEWKELPPHPTYTQTHMGEGEKSLRQLLAKIWLKLQEAKALCWKARFYYILYKYIALWPSKFVMGRPQMTLQTVAILYAWSIKKANFWACTSVLKCGLQIFFFLSFAWCQDKI